MNDDEADTDEASARVKLGQLVQDHADLDAAVQALALVPMPDMMVIARLKRKKLALKDEIQRLKNELLPDIIA
jgi:hypothetical protein